MLKYYCETYLWILHLQIFWRKIYIKSVRYTKMGNIGNILKNDIWRLDPYIL